MLMLKEWVIKFILLELQLNNASTSDTDASFKNLYVSILDGFASSKIYDKGDDFYFNFVNFLFLDGDIPTTSYLNFFVLLGCLVI